MATTPTFTSAALTNDTAPVITGTAGPNEIVTLSIGGATYTVTSTTNTWSLDLATATPVSGTLNLNSNGANPVSAMAIDINGDASFAATQTLVIDTTPPSAPMVSLDEDTGVSSTDGVTSNGKINIFGLETGGRWEYSLDGGNSWSMAGGSSLTFGQDLPRSLIFRQFDAAGNVSQPSAPLNVTLDTTSPIALLTLADNDLVAGETTTVSIVFSERVSGLSLDDLAADNGILSNLTYHDGATWTATLTPGQGLVDNTNNVVLDMTGVTDIAGNAGHGISMSNNYAVDTASPVATLTLSDTSLGIGETATLTVTFSTAVTGFSLTDLSASGGFVSGLTTTDNITWIAVLTPNAGVTAVGNHISLDMTGIMDADGNAGTGTSLSNPYDIDTMRPTGSLIISDTNLAIGDLAILTVIFSERVTGFTTGDLSVSGATISNLSSADGGLSWTATMAPHSATSAEGEQITLDMAGVTDAAGNAGVGDWSSTFFGIDTVRPTATLAIDDTNITRGETAMLTVTFSEAVFNLTADDLDISGGTFSNFFSVDGGVTWNVMFTPDNGITTSGNQITLDLTGITDLAGNSGAGSSLSNAFDIDTADTTTPPSPTPPAPPAAPTEISGTDGDDWLPGSENADSIDGAGGNDTIYARGGDDMLRGGDGNDILGGGGGNDELRGGEGDDTLYGGAGDDEVYGGEGSDTAWAGVGNDLVRGANGDDVLGGGNGEDMVSGGAGADTLYGSNGSDTLSGDGGDDWLYGGAGADILTGGKGNDRLAGGARADTFVFAADEGDDTIMGFDAAEGDRIDLGGQGYTVSEGGDGFATLTLSGGGTIHLAGIEVTEIQNGWFL